MMLNYSHSILASTAFHALELGFRTILIEDCSRGIREENIAATFSRVRAEYGCVVHSSEVRRLGNTKYFIFKSDRLKLWFKGEIAGLSLDTS